MDTPTPQDIDTFYQNTSPIPQPIPSHPVSPSAPQPLPPQAPRARKSLDVPLFLVVIFLGLASVCVGTLTNQKHQQSTPVPAAIPLTVTPKLTLTPTVFSTPSATPTIYIQTRYLHTIQTVTPSK